VNGARAAAVPFAVLLTLGCSGGGPGGDGGGGDTDTRACFFSGALSGAVNEAIDWSPPDGCGTSPFEDRIAFTWFRNTPHLIVALEIPSGVEQAVATPGLAGHHHIVSDGGEWASSDGDCTIDLAYSPGDDPNQLFIDGRGSCTAPAETVPPSGSEVTLAQFTFGAWVTAWQ
jgi:hypothetical protein